MPASRSQTRYPLFSATLLAFGLAGDPLRAQVDIPISNQIAEVELLLNARKPADALGLLDEIIQRAQNGQVLPAGVSMERLMLTAANANFQTQQYARAAELGASVEKIASVGASALGEARMIRGLSLALEKKYAEAIPVFKAAEASSTFRDKALLYGAMSAAEADQLPVAINTYNRLLATSPRDRDWAGAALSLIELHVRSGNLADASRGLALLRGNLGEVDNLAGLNLLTLQLGDALMKEGDNFAALAAYRTLLSRDPLVAEQERRNIALQALLARLSSLRRPSATEADTIRRVTSRLEQAKASLEQLQKLPTYDATLRYRLGYAFQERGGVWEAALLYEDLIANYPESPERENAFFGLVRAYSDAGRLDKTRQAADRFIRAYPESKFGAQALYLAALAAAQRNDLEAQLTFLGIAFEKFPNSELTEPMLLMRANALFTVARYAEAKEITDAYVNDFPAGRYIEESRYLSAMAELAEGRASAAESRIHAYLKDFPAGRFVPDARYRLAAVAYSKQDYAGCISLVEKWLTDFPAGHPQRGELHSLLADAQAGLGRPADAIINYRRAIALPLSDEQLGYVLDEVTRLYQTSKQYDDAVSMWEDFAAERPDHPYVINAAYWISRIRTREGRSDEALDLVARIIRRYVTDPARGDVERLLVETASTLARPARVKRGEPKAEPVSEEVLFARVDSLLLDEETGASPTAQARALFTQAEIASLQKNDARQSELLGQIASRFAPDQLPPGILGKVGDSLLARGQPELAQIFYEQIVTGHPKSIFADFGYVGLGKVALLGGNGDEALSRFNAAIDVAGARFKLKEATLGRARANLLLGRLDAAQALYEQVAGNRAWRGEATAESLFQLGEIAMRRGTPDDIAKAQAHYQRVYLGYKRFDLWVARAYLRSADAFVALGQKQEAIDTLNRLLSFESLRSLPEADQARERLRKFSA